MKAFGRLLQILGLILLPLSMFMNLTDSFGESFHILQMLIMTALGLGAFYLGRIVEGYASR